MKNVIELSNISKSYYSKLGSEYKILKDINLEIEHGEMISVTGDSGSGKTTLLNILGCIINATSGTYYLNNQKINSLDKNSIQKIKNQYIGFITQDFDLLTDMYAYQNVELPLLFNPQISYEEIPDLIDAALSKVGMVHMKNEKVEHLSGGEKQKIAIARAIVMNPNIILADEPTGSLDVRNTNEIIKLLKEINKKGTTIILVTHNPLVAKDCDREIILYDGKIIS